jgi:hypothetical protein
VRGCYEESPFAVTCVVEANLNRKAGKSTNRMVGPNRKLALRGVQLSGNAFTRTRSILSLRKTTWMALAPLPGTSEPAPFIGSSVKYPRVPPFEPTTMSEHLLLPTDVARNGHNGLLLRLSLAVTLLHV